MARRLLGMASWRAFQGADAAFQRSKAVIEVPAESIDFPRNNALLLREARVDLVEQLPNGVA